MPWQRYRYDDFFPRTTPQKAKGGIKGRLATKKQEML